MAVGCEKETDGDGVENQFVAEWVESLAGFSDGVHVAGDVAVDCVSAEREAKDNTCDRVAFAAKALRDVNVRNTKRDADAANAD